MADQPITLLEFKLRGKELIDALPSLNEAELENAFKMFALSYFGVVMDDVRAEIEAPITLQIVSKMVLDKKIEMGWD